MFNTPKKMAVTLSVMAGGAFCATKSHIQIFPMMQSQRTWGNPHRNPEPYVQPHTNRCEYYILSSTLNIKLVKMHKDAKISTV